MKIGVLAEKSGVDRQTIRYYESLNLLDAPNRTPAGYRVYDECSIQQLDFIRKAKSIGLTLKDIKKLIDLSSVGTRNCGEIANFAREKITEVREKIAHLQSIERSLNELQALCKENTDSVHCPFVENLINDTNNNDTNNGVK